MLARMIGKSLFKNLRITAWTLVTLTACASLVSMFTNIYFDTDRKMSSTLRQLGANAIAYPVSHLIKQNSTKWQVLEKVVKQENVQMVQLCVQPGIIRGKPVAIVAANPEKLMLMTLYWAISGRRAAASGECLIGRRAADVLKLKQGMTVNILQVAGVNEKTDWRITGIIDSGDEDENRIFIPVKNLSPGSLGKSVFSYALLSVPDGEAGIEQLKEQLGAVKDEIEVKPLYQILYGEKTTLKKVALLSGLSLLTVLILTSLGVSSAVLARIIERRKELALMQALGAKRRSVAGFLLLESAVVGAASSLAGFGIGVLFSQIVAQQIFHVSSTPHSAAFLFTLFATIGVSLLTGCIGAGRALRIQPAAALRGE